MTDPKPRRKRRTKASITASIDLAATAEIVEKGFVSALVTNIIKNAEIEPQVFYNRFKDINEFYDAFVRRYDSCLQDLLQRIDEPIVAKQGATELLKAILQTINDDPVALELLRWEVSDKNKTTIRTSLLREINFQPLTQGFVRSFKGSGIDIMGIFAILVGGIYYISLHKKLAPFYSIDLNTPEGCQQTERVLDYLVSLIYDSKNQTRREAEITERLRAQGVREDIIAKAMAAPSRPADPSAQASDSRPSSAPPS